MNHLLVAEYPYHSIKVFFDDRAKALAYDDLINNPFYYPNKLLSVKVYPLKSFTNESRFEVIPSVINKSFGGLK
jgi:hypothetical protein